jgi:hypothetical protein
VTEPPETGLQVIRAAPLAPTAIGTPLGAAGIPVIYPGVTTADDADWTEDPAAFMLTTVKL